MQTESELICIRSTPWTDHRSSENVQFVGIKNWSEKSRIVLTPSVDQSEQHAPIDGDLIGWKIVRRKRKNMGGVDVRSPWRRLITWLFSLTRSMRVVFKDGAGGAQEVSFLRPELISNGWKAAGAFPSQKLRGRCVECDLTTASGCMDGPLNLKLLIQLPCGRYFPRCQFSSKVSLLLHLNFRRVFCFSSRNTGSSYLMTKFSLSSFFVVQRHLPTVRKIPVFVRRFPEYGHHLVGGSSCRYKASLLCFSISGGQDDEWFNAVRRLGLESGARLRLKENLLRTFCWSAALSSLDRFRFSNSLKWQFESEMSIPITFQCPPMADLFISRPPDTRTMRTELQVTRKFHESSHENE